MGISEVEFLGSDDDAEPDDESQARPGPDPESGPGPGTGLDRATGSAQSDREAVGIEPPRRRFRTPGLAPGLAVSRRLRASGWVTPATVLLAVLILAVAGGAFAVVRHQNQGGDDFDLSLISAQYSMRQDASGIDLAMAVQNSGSSMVELTGVSVDQPGLIRFSQNEQAPGIYEYEAGSPQQVPLGLGSQITPVALAPKDVEMVTVPFRYDCSKTTQPPVTRAVGLTGFSARGAAHTVRLPLPLDTTPWQARDALRDALCNQPSPQADLKVAYNGYGDTLMELTPVRFNYRITLTAPASTTVTVDSVSQVNPGISASTDPAVPVTVLDGQSVQLTITWQVMSCVIATSVHSVDGVEITASANQTVQTWKANLGAQFTKDLDAQISTVCSGG